MIKQHILILDDEPIIRNLLEDILSPDYKISQTDSGVEALNILSKNEIDLVLVDINMPGMNGIEFIQKARINYPNIAYIIISGNQDIDSAIDALHSGVWDFIKKPFTDFYYLKNIIRGSLENKQLILENKQYKENLEQIVQKRTLELEKKNMELIQSRNRIIGILSSAAEFKDYETGQHFFRVSQYSGIIAEALGLHEKEVDIIRQAAPVHDIGKIGIPEKLLLKEGKLTDSEYIEIQKHCLYGEEILRSKSFDKFTTTPNSIDDGYFNHSDNLLNVAAKIAKSHHERYNGSGYPEGLTDINIPQEAKIVAVADVYDAIGTIRPYKKAWDESSCQEYIKSNAGVLFNPEVVQAFISNIDKIVEIKTTFIDDIYQKKSYI